MRAEARETARVLENRNEQGRKVKPQKTCPAGPSTNLGAKESRYAVIPRIPFSVVPTDGTLCQPDGRFPYPSRVMIATELTEHAVNFLDWNFMDNAGIQFIPDGMKQECPELSVALSIGAFHADNNNR